RDRLQDRRARRRPGQGAPRRAAARRRAVARALRVPLAGPVQPGARPHHRARVPRRDPPRRRGQARALLLHVRAALLLHEDHAGSPRRAGGEGTRVPREGERDLPAPVNLVSFSDAAERLAAADDWLFRHRRGRLVVCGATLDAAGEALRRLAARAGAGAGWHRTTPARLAAALATPLLAPRGLAPAGALPAPALCARLLHEGEAL